MNKIELLLNYAAKLPGGLNDPRSVQKLAHELDELKEALVHDDYIGALTEAADAAYYVVKHLQYVAALLGITVDEVMDCGLAKYELRAQPGNPKNDNAERTAVLSALKEGNKDVL